MNIACKNPDPAAIGNPTTNRETHHPRQGSLAVLLLASMMNLMGGAAVAPALPQISAVFPEASPPIVALIITLPALAIALTGLLIGTVADRAGKTKVLAVSAVVFALAGTTGLYAQSMETLLVGRFVLGIGIAGITVATTALIAESYSGAQKARVLALQSASMGVGILVLESSGGFLAELGWRMPFLVYLLGVVIFFGVVIFVRDPKQPPRTSDLPLATEKHVHSEKPIGQAAEAPENAQDVPTSRPSVAATVVGGIIAIFMLEILTFLFPSKLPYFVAELGSTAAASGLILGIHGCCMAGASLLQNRLASHLSRPTLLATGFGLMGLCFFGFWLVPHVVMVLVAATVGGVGIGLVMPTVLQWLSSAMTPETSGKIMGCYTTALNLGQFASSLVIAPVLVAAGSLQVMFCVFGIIALACAAAALASRSLSMHV